MPEDTPVEQAVALVRVLDWMHAGNRYDERGSLDRMERLHAQLKPAWDSFFGGFPLINPVTYPANVWFPRIWEKARTLLSLLEANPTWTPGDAVLVASSEAGWIPERLWAYVSGSIEHARATGKPEHWGQVTANAVRFLEDELRARARLTEEEVPGRQAVAARAFRWEGGVLRMKRSKALQEAWMYFTQGILTAFGNPGAHNVRRHKESFAMGVVGAVSAALVTMDEELGPLTDDRLHGKRS